MSAPSPKRQRLPGSFSPVSPPYHLTAKGVTGSAEPATIQPQTPISPSNMSSSGTGNSNPTSPTHPISSSVPFSGSSSAHISTQTSATTALPTPASSVKGGSSSMTDEDILMADVTSHPSIPQIVAQDSAMTDSASHNRTNHDRQNDNDVQMEESDELPERLDPNAEPFHYVLEEPHPMSAPHPSQDLIAMYGLRSIATSVARRDPTTGDKINKIRKSYEGKIKTLGISGRNKPTTKPGELTGLFRIPEDAWQATEVSTRNVKKGPTAALESKLDRALKMNPGKLPPDEADKWKGLLAVDEPLKTKAANTDARRSGVQPSAGPSSTSHPAKAAFAGTATSPTEPARPQRTGKKRRYDDASFEGYAEGVDDDDSGGGAGGGYSSPEERLAAVSAAKKRRKKARAENGGGVTSPGGGVGSGGEGGTDTKKHFRLNMRAG
ncbi:MAG: hypothetical protein M1822_007912 [Bathelium mastoideum]|nr:MAG: hypothetical protein M1822_007912 [Bathelium mastoideum]